MKKYVQANQVHFKTKKISKQIMKRSRLRNKLNRKADIDRKGYNIYFHSTKKRKKIVCWC